MNATFGTTPPSSIQTWEDTPYSRLPTLLATAFTVLALTVASVAATTGFEWPRGDGQVHPAAARYSVPALAGKDLTYYIVGSTAQSDNIHSIEVQAALERAQSGSVRDRSYVVRLVATPSDEQFIQEELNSYYEGWSVGGHSLTVVDLR
jgi:hypothetical protein